MSYVKIPCAIIRGGTSKGIFFNDYYLPKDPNERDRVIHSVFGSPHHLQIDGLGGADPLTSKVAIIKTSNRNEADIEYTFGQVSIHEASINYSLNCGNISAGAAIFAVDEGLVKIEEPVTTVRIFNTNTETFISARVRVKDGKAATTGDFTIDGVPGKSAMIELTFPNASGAITGELLPTKKVVDNISISKGKVDVSIVDAGNLYIFIMAKDLGLKGSEPSMEIEENKKAMELTKEIFDVCSRIVNERMCPKEKIKIQKLALVSGVTEKMLHSKKIVGLNSKSVDFISRIISYNTKVHKAYAVTGAICAGFAAVISGSVVNRALCKNPEKEIRIGHPQGVIDIEIEREELDKGIFIPRSATIKRTARRIMDGYVYIKNF